jgi:hypothetical protein
VTLGWVVGYFEFRFNPSTRAINILIPAQQITRSHQGPSRTGRINRSMAKKMRHPDGALLPVSGRFSSSVTYAALSALRCS